MDEKKIEAYEFYVDNFELIEDVCKAFNCTEQDIKEGRRLFNFRRYRIDRKLEIIHDRNKKDAVICTFSTIQRTTKSTDSEIYGAVNALLGRI